MQALLHSLASGSSAAGSAQRLRQALECVARLVPGIALPPLRLLCTSAPTGSDRPSSSGSSSSLEVGATFATTQQFSANEVQRFVSITGDANPIHVDAAAAAAAGILMASLFPAIIGSHFPGAVYLSQTLSFRAPATVGEALRAEVTVVRRSGSRVSFRTACSLANSGVLLVDGSAVALIKPQQ